MLEEFIEGELEQRVENFCMKDFIKGKTEIKRTPLLTGRLSDSGPTSPPSKWRCPKCYTMIIPPMGGDHFGMGPGAQRSSVAEIAIFRFFSSDFCFAPGAPILGPCYWKVSYKR